MDKIETDIYINKSDTSLSFRSNDIQEILSRRQGFLTQWAIYIILFVIILFFIAANFIKYPDIVTTSAKLMGYNAPKEIITKQEGKIIKLFVSNETNVIRGKPLIWIEAIASHTEVLKLGIFIDSSINLLIHDSSKNINFIPNFNQLGELQTAFSDFVSNYQVFSDFYINGHYQKNLEVLNKDLIAVANTIEKLQSQKNITIEDIKLVQQNFAANEQLYKEKIISKQELRIEKSKLLNKQQLIPQIETSILSNFVLEREKKKQINDLKHQWVQQRNIFLQSLHTLKSQIDEWKRRYIISASESGKVVFILPLQENQYLIAGKILGYINPPRSNYYVEINLPQKNFGKVHVGQKVQLRFFAYPYNEFGYVDGRITYISNVSSDSGFAAKVELPDGLVTSQRYRIQYKNGLKADALIITKDLTIIKRILFTIRNPLSR
jgi:HlyD family secretion protein